MSKIRSKDTGIEIALRTRLWHEGIRYRKNLRTLPGKPDIVITKYKIAIFCDSSFWHGKTYNEKTFDKTENRDFWNAKITKNIERDNVVNQMLKQCGYIVIRLTDSQIINEIDSCVLEITNTIELMKNSLNHSSKSN